MNVCLLCFIRVLCGFNFQSETFDETNAFQLIIVLRIYDIMYKPSLMKIIIKRS